MSVDLDAGFPPTDESYEEDYPDDWEEDQACMPADYEFIVLTPLDGPGAPAFIVQQIALGGTNDRTVFLPFLPRGGRVSWWDGLEGHAYTYSPLDASGKQATIASAEEMKAAAQECRAALLALGCTENREIKTILLEQDQYALFAG